MQYVIIVFIRRFLEAVLHISYRLEVKKWACRTPESKAICAAKKAKIQEAFKTKMGLLVDQVKQGFGTTNDGNTARRIFADPELAAEITGIG